MSIPVFSAESTIAPVVAVRASARRVGAPAGLFWSCFRNCYDRCGGQEGSGHYDWCFATCYYLCNWKPTIWF